MNQQAFREWLDSQDFYELCQQYRHAKDGSPPNPGSVSAVDAFDALKMAILAEATKEE